MDYVVVAEADDHWQTYGEQYNPAYCGNWNSVLMPSVPGLPFGPKKIIARRALLELMRVADAQHRRRPLVVNLGIGAPECIAAIARKERLGGRGFVLTVESGAIGGYPAGGNSFGATEHPQGMLTQGEQFDLYDGGGIDIAFLGFGQMDGAGRVNVCSVGERLNGVGGFVNISQSAQRIVFCGAFTASGLQLGYDAMKGLAIEQEGRLRKLVPKIERVCYDPGGTARCRQPLLITERAVFSVSVDGLELREVAPGCDVQRDIVAQSDIPIRIAARPSPMPAQVFADDSLVPT